MARLRIKTKRTSLTISTRHAIRVGPFHGSYTERPSCHEHTSEARLGCRAVLRRRLSVRHGHGCNPCLPAPARREPCGYRLVGPGWAPMDAQVPLGARRGRLGPPTQDRKSTRLNSSHGYISYAVFCLKKKKKHASECSDRRSLYH